MYSNIQFLISRSTFAVVQMDPSDPLNGVDKEKTDIFMYCTGGIRCDVYSTILR
jgi:predicted sulfurtransferase